MKLPFPFPFEFHREPKAPILASSLWVLWALRVLSFFIAVSTGAPDKALAAACCGGGGNAPAMILGDDRMMFSTALSTTQVDIDSVDSNGYWYTSDQHQNVQTLRLEAARMIEDRWQVGASLPVISRHRQAPGVSSSQGFGDLSLTTAFEYLPDWDYNIYRPKGFIGFQVGIPTSTSKLESDLGGIDSRGLGFFTFGTSVAHTKVISSFDATQTLEVHRGFPRQGSIHGQDTTLSPGWGGSASLSMGYHLKDWRLGTGIAWTYEDEIRSDLGTSAGLERYATGSISLTYLRSDEWTITGTYSNQTWFGSPVNTSLGSSLALAVQHHWLR